LHAVQAESKLKPVRLGSRASPHESQRSTPSHAKDSTRYGARTRFSRARHVAQPVLPAVLKPRPYGTGLNANAAAKTGRATAYTESMMRILVLVVCASSLVAQKKPVTLDALARQPEARRGGVAYRWSPDGKQFVYQQSGRLMLYDIAERKARELLA